MITLNNAWALLTTPLPVLVKLHQLLGYSYKENRPLCGLSLNRYIEELGELAYDWQV
jgi:hypothetical protein